MTEGKEPYDKKAARLRYLVYRLSWRLYSGSEEIVKLFNDPEASDYAKSASFTVIHEYAFKHNDPQALALCQQIQEPAKKANDALVSQVIDLVKELATQRELEQNAA